MHYQGHPKDGRWDLNQFIFGMATNQHGIPLFVKTFSGNESDKKTLLLIIQSLRENLDFKNKVYHIADSAFFTEENLRVVEPHMFWISRVPAIIGAAKDLLDLGTSFSPPALIRAILGPRRILSMPGFTRNGLCTSHPRCVPELRFL